MLALKLTWMEIEMELYSTRMNDFFVVHTCCCNFGARLSRVLCVVRDGFHAVIRNGSPNHRYLGSREARNKASHTSNDRKGDSPNTFLIGSRRSSRRCQNVTNTAIEIRRSISSAEIRVSSGNSERKVSELKKALTW